MWLLTWPFFNSTKLAELSQLSTFLRFLQTTTFWSAKYLYCHYVTRYVTFSIHVEHPSPINLVELLVLGWPFIILKALNPTGGPARSKEDLATFKSSLLRAPTQPTWWLNPPLIAVLAKILMTANTSLLVEPSLRVAIVASLFLPQYVLLLPLLHLSLLRLLLLAPPTLPWLGTWRITSNGLSRPFLRPDFFLFRLLHLFRLPLLPPLRTMKTHVSDFWKLGS